MPTAGVTDRVVRGFLALGCSRVPCSILPDVSGNYFVRLLKLDHLYFEFQGLLFLLALPPLKFLSVLFCLIGHRA